MYRQKEKRRAEQDFPPFHFNPSSHLISHTTQSSVLLFEGRVKKMGKKRTGYGKL